MPTDTPHIYVYGPGRQDQQVPLNPLPGEWCDDCEDWIVNCGCNDEDREADRREREDEERWLQGEAYEHNRGICDGAGACRFCDERPAKRQW